MLATNNTCKFFIYVSRQYNKNRIFSQMRSKDRDAQRERGRKSTNEQSNFYTFAIFIVVVNEKV